MAAIAARHEQFGKMRAEGKPITLANSLTVAEHVAESCSRSSAELNELQPVTGTERYSEQCRSDIEQLAEVTAKQVTFTKRLADQSDSSVTSALLEEGAALGAKLDEFPPKLMSCATGFRRDFLRSGHEIPEEATRTIPDLLAEENATIAAMIRS